MELKKKLILSIMLLTVAMCGSAANALPDSGIFDGWGPSIIDFEYVVDGRTLTGQIEHAVYNAYPGDVQLAGQYVYAYQITNSEGSDVGIDSFAVGILEGATVVDIAVGSPASGGDVEPFHAYFSPDQPTAQSAVWWFLPSSSLGEGVVEAGQESVVLLFSSNNAPAPTPGGFASISGGGIAVMVENENLPTPIPEPTTIILLGGSWAMLAAIRRRRSV